MRRRWTQLAGAPFTGKEMKFSPGVGLLVPCVELRAAVGQKGAGIPLESPE